MNKQSFITILLTVLISMTGAKAFAHDIEVANSDGKTIYYVWTNNNTELAVSYRGSYGSDYSNEYSGNVIIPSSVVYNGNTYSVTSIGNETFFNCSLTSVTIPNSVTSIGSSAFEGCSGLTSVTIPNSVTSIGRDAFDWCSGLTSVSIPNSVTSIGETAFRRCSGLTSIVVETGNAKYDSRDNCNAIIETSSNALIAGCKNTVIPNSVTSIGYEAFFGCSGLTSVTIPNSVTSIGNLAFSGCSGLTSIVVETGNAKYDSRDNCNAIIETSSNALIAGCKNTVIPNSVTSIGKYAFDGCSSLTSITIPNSVTTIGDYAFCDCSGLIFVTIPNSVTSIGISAFDGCSGLTSVTISNSVKSISVGAFIGCKALTSVTIPNSVTSIGNLAFYLCSGLTSVTIPNSVTEISDDAFYYCRSLTSVTIPNSVTYIGRDAFYGCDELTDVYCQAEKLRNNKWSGEGLYTYPSAFSFPQAMTLHVPAASIEAYKAIEPWNDFMSIVALEGISIHGDVTGNGTVDDEDIAFVLNCIINSIFDTKADINHDSKVNVADLVDIVNIIKNNGAQKY